LARRLAVAAWLTLLLSGAGALAQTGHIAADPKRGEPPNVVSQIIKWLQQSIQTPPQAQTPGPGQKAAPIAQPAPEAAQPSPTKSAKPSGNIQGVDHEFAMPDVQGLGLAAAHNVLAKFDLNNQTQVRQISASPPDIVSRQDPPPKTPVTNGTPVILTLSDSYRVRVPIVRGETPNKAAGALADVGLRLGDDHPVNSNTKAGLILATTPAAGSVVNRGGQIDYSTAVHAPLGSNTGTSESAVVAVPLPDKWGWLKRYWPWFAAALVGAGATVGLFHRSPPGPKPDLRPPTATTVIVLPPRGVRVKVQEIRPARLPALRLTWRVTGPRVRLSGLAAGNVRLIRREPAA
jgi:hypothetical protein